MSGLKILVITPWYVESLTGGVAIAVQNLVFGLKTRKIKTTILVPVGDGWLPRYKIGPNNELILYVPIRGRSIKKRKFKSFLGYYGRFFTSFFLFSFLRFFLRYNLVHLHFCISGYDTIVRILRIFKIPYLITFHGTDLFYSVNSTKKHSPIHSVISRSVFITTVSNFMLDLLITNYPQYSAKTLTISNPIPYDFLQRLSSTENTTLEDIDILFVGSFREAKGPDLLARSLLKIAEEWPGLRTLWIGTGPLQKKLYHYFHEAGLMQHVSFAGSVSRHDIIQYYRRSKVIVIPSRMEAFCLVAIEAAMVGKPVVATSVGALPEVIRHFRTGILVEPDSAEELAQGTLLLLRNDSLRRDFGLAAKEHVMTSYNPTKIYNNYISLYHHILKTNKKQ